MFHGVLRARPVREGPEGEPGRPAEAGDQGVRGVGVEGGELRHHPEIPGQRQILQCGVVIHRVDIHVFMLDVGCEIKRGLLVHLAGVRSYQPAACIVITAQPSHSQAGLRSELSPPAWSEGVTES